MTNEPVTLEGKSIEYRLKEIESIAHIGSWSLNFRTGISIWSEEACRIYGLDPLDNIQTHQSWLSFIHPDDLNDVLMLTQKVVESNEETSFYSRILHRDGTLKYIYTQTRTEFSKGGLPVGIYGVIHDVSDQKIAEEKLAFESANLSSLINNTTDLMWSVARDYTLITSNDAFNKITHLILGNPIERGSNILSAGFPQDQLERYRKYYERAFAGETFTEIEHNETPIEFWTEISFYPICEKGEIIGTACHSRDITERKKMSIQSAKLTADLVLQNKNLEQFAYMVSHNLRAPLANIMGLCDVLSFPEISIQSREEIMGSILQSSKRLDQVVTDLNYVLQIRNNTDEKREDVLFSEILENTKGCFASKVENSQISISYDFNEVKGMHTIKPYLKNIFYNLLSNSIKFKRKGVDAIIEVKSYKAGNNIGLIFKDNGMGINLEKNKDNLFGMYKRFHSEIEGKGIGLFLTQQQVETLGGKISVKSEVNKGSEFNIELPNNNIL